MNIDEFTPTHTLLIQQDEDGSNGKIPVINKIVQLYSNQGYSVHICLLEDQIKSDYPDILGEIQRKFSQSESSGCYIGTFPNCEDALMSLLSIQTWHRRVSLVSLTILRKEEPVLHYVPDHNVFEVDVNLATDSEEKIRSVTENRSACLLPKATLAEWEFEGISYEITPPSLCVDNTCFRLSKLQDVIIDKDELSISLSWSTTDQRGAKLISHVFGFLGSSRPTVLEFCDQETFESVSEVFSMITEKFED